MKLTLCFLAVFVVASHQQFYNHGKYKLPWYSNFQSAFDDGDYYPPTNRFVEYPLGRFNPFVPAFDMIDEEVNPWYTPQTDNQSPQSIEGRVKGFKIVPTNRKQQQQRFFFGGINGGVNNNNVIGNPLIKTATFTITSTCTALSVINCIPAASILAPPVACARRRRDILPSQVQIIMPTAEASIDSMLQERQSSTEVASSKSDNDETALDNLSNRNIARAKRFFGLWQQFVTGLTVTTWNVLSVTSTKTYLPTDSAGVAVVLSCIPPGYITC